MIRNYHSETPLNKTKTSPLFCWNICILYTNLTYLSKIFFLPELFLTILCLWVDISKGTLKWKMTIYYIQVCFSHVWSLFKYDWLEFIHFFPPCSASLKLQSLHSFSNGQKLWDQLLKYGKMSLLSFWLIALVCYVCVSGEGIAIILTETTQQKHGPLLSVYCIMGVTGYLSPILRSLLVFPTRYDSFTTAGLRLGLFLTS